MNQPSKAAVEAAKKKFGPIDIGNGFHSDWISGYDTAQQENVAKIERLQKAYDRLRGAINGTAPMDVEYIASLEAALAHYPETKEGE